MDSDICISVKGISKKFSRSLKKSFVYGATDIIRNAVGREVSTTLRASEFWALRDISFELRRGESIGIIGLNGGGKTTLLRIISGILKPTKGHVFVSGQIAPMLALGAGFKPVLSGRENIFLNMSLLGVPHHEIQQRYNDVVAFSELEDAIDAPLGTYSTGMRMRLGFSCAVHTDPSILIVDEVLSVGDAQFRAKCRNKINELRSKGVSMLIVSHSSISIETLSDRCVYLDAGRMAMIGAPADVLESYGRASVAKAKQHLLDNNNKNSQLDELGGNKLSITNIKLGLLSDPDGGYWQVGEVGKLEVGFSTQLSEVEDISVNLIIIDLDRNQGENVQFFNSSTEAGWFKITQEHSVVTLSVEPVCLLAGNYRIKLSISTGPMHDIAFTNENIKLVVKGRESSRNCVYHQPRNWSILGGESTGVELIEDCLSEDF